MKDYVFTLVGNESEGMYEEWGTANFKMPFNEKVIRNVYDIEEAILRFKEACKSFSNDDWYYEYRDDETYGTINTGNDEDGLSLNFEIELL